LFVHATQWRNGISVVRIFFAKQTASMGFQLVGFLLSKTFAKF
jgi:hypothetical protein